MKQAGVNRIHKQRRRVGRQHRDGVETPEEQRGIVSLPSQRDTTGINTWMVYDSKSVEAARCQTGLTSHPIVLQILFKSVLGNTVKIIKR